MNEIIQNITAAILAQSWLEVVAVITAILYLVLAVRENIWCWFYGFISTGIYIFLFYHVSLLSESTLNFYYLIMAIYGWVQWNKKGLFTKVKIHKLQSITHIKILVACAALTPAIGYFMNKWGASFPYLDAFVALLAVVATLMTTKKIFENWYYWLVVDVISIYLFWQKEMFLTAALFVVYIVLIFVGIKHWKKLMKREVQMSLLHKKAIIKLQDIPELNKRGILSIQATDKGLINYNFNVKTISGTIHARVNRANVLGINRNHEAFVLEKIKALKIAPKTIVNNIQEGYLIKEFVDSPMWTTKDCYKHQQLLINQIKKIHVIDLSDKLPIFITRLQQYEARSLNLLSPTNKEGYLKTKHVLAGLGFFEVNQLLHFDLNSTNLLGTTNLTIIDWEFAGAGHPVFDLAIFIYTNKLEINKCEIVLAYCNTFDNGAAILRLSIKLAEYMIELWEVKN